VLAPQQARRYEPAERPERIDVAQLTHVEPAGGECAVQRAAVVAADVPDGAVDLTEERLVRGHEHQQMRAGVELLPDAAQGADVVGYVLQDVEADRGVERPADVRACELRRVELLDRHALVSREALTQLRRIARVRLEREDALGRACKDRCEGAEARPDVEYPRAEERLGAREQPCVVALGLADPAKGFVLGRSR